MRKIIALILLALPPFFLSAQNTLSFNTIIGKEIPDIKIGKVINNIGNISNTFEGKSSFTEFKGKLIILDFWDIYCASCISGFKKMSALQEKYNDKIQVFLVNIVQDENKIIDWLHKQNQRLHPNKIVPANLPIIANSKKLKELFPIRGEIGYCVWIGPDSKVKLRGISQNINELKIDSVLSGREVSFVEDNALAYNTKQPYFQSKPGQRNASPLYTSSFGLFDDKQASAYGVEVDNFEDTINSSKRNSYINFEIFKLLKIATLYKIHKDTSFLFGERIITNIKDLSKITLNEQKLKRSIRDDDFRNKVSYEQIVPLNLPDSVAKDMMFSDLEKYLQNHLGIVCRWEERELPCYKVEQLDSFYVKKRVISKMSFNYEYRGDSMFYKYNGYKPSILFRDYFDKLKTYASVYINDIIIDALPSNVSIDLMLPDPFYVRDLKWLNSSIRHQGFILRPDTVKLKVLVISKQENG